MAYTTLTGSTPVPTDRQIVVTVRLDPETVTADRVFPELRRHMAVSTTLIKDRKNAAGAVTARDYTATGTAYRAWTKSELANQLRYIGIPFDSIVIRHETAAAPSPLARAADSARRGLLATVPGGAAGNLAIDAATSALDEPAPTAPTWRDRLPIIIGGVAIALGLIVAGYAVVRS